MPYKEPNLAASHFQLKLDIFQHNFNSLAHYEKGERFWMARKIQRLLGYPKWKKFYKVIQSCQYIRQEHFKEVTTRSDRGRELQDFKLTLSACYLIFQSAHPRKEIVSIAQHYIVWKARLAEVLSSRLTEEELLRVK